MNVNVPIEELHRLVDETEHGMSREIAAVVSNLRLTAVEKRRMDELMDKSKTLGLEGDEHEEMLRFADLADLLAILRLRARRVSVDPAVAEVAGREAEVVA
jgi:hypothetical protein